MIYKFCPPNPHSLDNLRRNILYCRHFSDFNDPFEFWSKLQSGNPSPEEADRFREAVIAWGFADGVPCDPETAREYFDSLEDAQPDFEALFDYTRISCFCSDADNLLMWSHYAGGLRGFCIGYDEAELVGDSSRDYLTEVEYLDAPPAVDSFIYAVAEDQFDYHLKAIDEVTTQIEYAGKQERWPGEREDYRKSADEAFETMKTLWRRAFAAKPREWSYEREVRLLVRTSEAGQSPVERIYPPSAVTQILIGEKMDRGYRDQLIGLLRDRFPNVRPQIARRKREIYGLELIPES